MGTWSSLPDNRDTREQEKFDLDSDGKVIVRTSVKGTFRPTGLNNGGLITEVTINSSTWTPVPATALSGRNAICIQNLSGKEIKLNYDNSVVGYVGITLYSGSERHYDITDLITIYAKSSDGSATITAEEIS